MNAWKEKFVRLLRWSQKYTGTDMVYLFSGGSWLTLGKIVTAAGTFILAIAFANLLPQEVFGSYQFVLSVVAILSILTLPGIDTALIRAVSKGLKESVLSCFKARLKWGFLASLASLLFSIYYLFVGNNILALSFLVATAFIPLLEASKVYQSYLQGLKDFKLSAIYSSVAQIVATVIIIVAIFVTDNLVIILLSFFVSWTLIHTLLYKVTVKNLNKEESDEHREVVSYGKHLTLMKVLAITAEHLDKVLLFHFLGATQTAVYAFAIAAPEQVKGVLKNIYSLALPKFSEKTDEELVNTIGSKTLKFSIFLLFAVIVYIFIAPFVYKIFFPAYTESIFLSQVFSVSLLAISQYLPVGALQARAEVKKLYFYNILSNTLQIILLVLGVIFYGVIGVVLARVISRFLNLLISLRLASK